MQQRTSSSSSRDSGECKAINAAEQLRPKPGLAINYDKVEVHLNVNGMRENISKENHLSLDVKNLNLNEENGEANEPRAKFTFDELAAATGNFKSKCYIGEGGFGKVYKGQLGNQIVAVKKLDPNGQGIREFDVELSTLSLADHPNIVKLIGFCAEGEKKLLIYEYMPLGSLEKHLHDLPRRRKPLDWNTRMKIAAGAARGLEYLHHTMKPPVIYRDLKSSNILLSEGYEAKLSDFGLAAKVGPSGDKTHVSTRVMGTYGYCDPEYAMTGHLKFHSDIYSFGVLLLELITGRKAIDHTKSAREQNLVAWAKADIKRSEEFSEMADPLLEGRYPLLGLYQALSVAVMCVQGKPDLRPAISDVVIALDYIASQKYYPQIHHSVQNSRRSPSSPPAQKDTEHRQNVSNGTDIEI